MRTMTFSTSSARCKGGAGTLARGAVVRSATVTGLWLALSGASHARLLPHAHAADAPQRSSLAPFCGLVRAAVLSLHDSLLVVKIRRMVPVPAWHSVRAYE